jgi:hypothetical protein
MAFITWSNVCDACVEIKAATPAQLPFLAQSTILTVVNGSGISISNFGGEGSQMLTDARILLAAHMATMWMRRGVSGAITSQSEGGASQAYALGLKNPRVLDLTSYGMLFRQLAMGSAARAGLLL